MITDWSWFRDGPLEKLWLGRGIFELQELFFVINSLYEFLLGESVNIFLGLIGVHEFFFSFNFPLREFCASPAPRPPPPPPPTSFLIVRRLHVYRNKCKIFSREARGWDFRPREKDKWWPQWHHIYTLSKSMLNSSWPCIPLFGVWVCLMY